MPIAKGTMSYLRFFVENESTLSPEDILEKLNNFRFRPLHEQGEDNESHGWCPFLAEYDNDKSIKSKDFYFDDQTVLVLRSDSITLPKGLLKANVKKSIQGYFQEHGNWPDRVVKKEIEKAEAKALRARMLPKTKILEALWCQKTKELRVFSRSSSMVDRFIDLFKASFVLSPQLKDFAHTAFLQAEKNAQTTELINLSHRPLFEAPLRVDIN